jgi:GalNAc-alpha-(1->4)-GalNAc-alpha-(1->3)-diNAcBac-PP-undecaprenol alpha-1,4-N-acetyl-D-galactosaminyltransferase
MTDCNSRRARAPSIVLVIGTLRGGGAERQLSEMANYWAKKQFNVTVATWSGPEIPDFYWLSPSVSREWLNVRLPNGSHFGKLLALVRRLLKLRKLLRLSRPDAVLSFVDVSNVHTILAASGLGVRVVVSERTSPAVNHNVAPLWRALRWLCYSWADDVVAQTRDAAHWIERNCRVRPIVIPNALRALPKVHCQRESMIVAIGRLSREKGFELLLQAFARVSSDFPDWRLFIIGDGPERTALVELRDKLNLRNRTELIDHVHDVETWMSRAGLLVHPSRREGFPNVVLEAMGMGTAVICADCQSGPAELIQNDVNGRLVPVGDIDALVLAMVELMSSPDIRKRLGREAAGVSRNYEQSAIIDKWEACLLRQRR